MANFEALHYTISSIINLFIFEELDFILKVQKTLNKYVTNYSLEFDF